MSETPREAEKRVGVMVVRVTLEGPGRPTPVLKVTKTFDVHSPLSEVSATTDVEEVCDSLRRWLGDFLARAGVAQSD